MGESAPTRHQRFRGRSMTPRKTATATTALAVTALLALTACNGGNTPSPSPSTTTSPTSTTSATPSPTPSATKPAAAPTTEEAAKDQAFAAVKKYWALEDVILKTDKGKNPERVDAIAIGDAAQTTRKYAAAVAKSPDKATGARTVAPYGGWVSALTYNGKKVPYGAAQLQVCNDMSKVIVKNPKGVQYPQPDPIRQVTEVDAVFDPSKGSWFITRVSVPEPIKSC